MIDSHAAGDTFKETALLFGISKDTTRTRIQSLLSQEKWLRRYEAGKNPLAVKGCRFTAQEDATLIKMRKGGELFREIADVLQRSRASVRTRWYVVTAGGLEPEPTSSWSRKVSTTHEGEESPWVSHCCRFNAQEDAEIIEMRKAGANFRDIGIALKRRPISVLRRYQVYLRDRHAEEPIRQVLTRTPEKKPWSQSELEILRSAIGTSRFHPKLALLLPGRPKHVIRAKLKEEKLLRSKATGGASEEHGSEH